MAGLKKRFENIASGASKLGFDPLGRDEVRYSEIPIAQISPDPTQPRKDLGDLSGLQASIQEHGIMQPLVISPTDEDTYIIIAGERRYTAAKALGLEKVPAVVRTVEDHVRLQLQLVENLHRQGLSPIEEAAGYRRLIDEFNLTQRDVAKRVGKSLGSINEVLRLLQLPEEIIEDVRTSEHRELTTKSVLLEISKEDDPARQRSLWEQAKKGALTVQQAREQKKGATDPGGEERPQPTRIKTSAAVVTVKMHEVSPTVDSLIQALEEAIQSLRENLVP